MFLKNPGFTFAVVTALAQGIGVNTAIFTLVDAVLLKPLNYPNADRIVEFGSRSSTFANFLSNIPEFHTYQRQTNVFEVVAAYDPSGPGFNLTGDRPEQIHGIHVTEGYFRLFDAPGVHSPQPPRRTMHSRCASLSTRSCFYYWDSIPT
jgi:hypothetical protein